ncbi:uncharacterized protein LOC129309002 [Prosopis cineraria]|uniref:uncharacterized protein LOC129309002 n=1 Tax=Prosopis cineraria TaxID=364024 RepID=UPI002410B480|nr:uncharacterized protein LOC129309002 [Prosopis cineraria]
MSAFVTKTILVALSLLLVASDYNSNATKVRVKNNLDEGKTLTLSCTYNAANNTKSAPVDGVLQSNQIKEFSFNSIATPSIDCTFKWKDTSHLFPIYVDYRDNPYCLTECTWSIKPDRPCRVDPNYSEIIYYCDTWIK